MRSPSLDQEMRNTGYLTPAEAAELCRCHKSTIYRFVRSGPPKLPDGRPAVIVSGADARPFVFVHVDSLGDLAPRAMEKK